MTLTGPGRPSLLGQVAVVTGNNQGIGAATVVALARVGAEIAAAFLRLSPDTDKQRRTNPDSFVRARNGLEVARAVSGKGRHCVTIEADLTDPASPGLIFDEAERIGPVSILVNNASGWRKDRFYSAATDRLGRANHALAAESVEAQPSAGGAFAIAEFAACHHRRRAEWGRIVSLARTGTDCFPGEVSDRAAKAAPDRFPPSAAETSASQASASAPASCIFPLPTGLDRIRGLKPCRPATISTTPRARSQGTPSGSAEEGLIPRREGDAKTPRRLIASSR
jgi:3-oxoacyl-[acyl-carrier protein] reductase